ncbi:MAG: ABC transporter ATP-binding protein [Chloroflexota bacterium]|nr:ABC transporter ATP-binding protein [Chloroflexota bacterium]
MSKAIRVEGLVKRYGDFAAVDNVSFDVSEGEIFGILGPNGAGKTTTLEIIEGLQPPTAGQVTVLGKDIRKQARSIKARIGVQLQSSAYFSFLTLREILNLLGSFYPKRLPPDELLGLVGLADRANSRVNQLSIGQSQRFTVAASLINDPELVILDEPTTGLDPQARHNLWDLISEMQARKVTVVLTTHYMEEAELLCQRLAIMDHGKIVAIDSPSDLISRIETTYTVKLQTDRPLSDGQSQALNEGGSVQKMAADPSSQTAASNSYVLRLDRNPESLNRALDGIVRSGISLKHLEIQPATLEDVFLELTGNELRD